MLQFIRPADPVFHAILNESLLTLKHYLLSMNHEDQKANWPVLYPRISKCLTPERAQRACADLLNAHHDQRVWNFTDIHALIMWESLFVFINLHAESSQRNPNNPNAKAVGPFFLNSIDLQWIEEFYFHTTDFLNATDYRMSLEFVRLLNWSESAYRAANGLPAKESDLLISMVNEQEPVIWKHAPLTRVSSHMATYVYPTWMEPVSEEMCQ